MRIVFSGRELEVMSVLWDRGSSTVAEVRDALDMPLAYTTVLTVLRILERKGYVDHVTENRAHRYAPLVDREVAATSALKRIIQTVFAGSPIMLFSNFVDTQSLSPAELKRIRLLLKERTHRKSGRKS